VTAVVEEVGRISLGMEAVLVVAKASMGTCYIFEILVAGLTRTVAAAALMVAGILYFPTSVVADAVVAFGT